MDSDDRTGKLIITRKKTKTPFGFLEELDAPVKMKTTSRFKLQHAESKDIQGILDEVIKNQQRIKQQLQGKNVAARARQRKMPKTLQPFPVLPNQPLIPPLQLGLKRAAKEHMSSVILLPSLLMKVMRFWFMGRKPILMKLVV